jgi:hypothetical protein
MELKKNESQELFPESNTVNLWSLDIETIPRTLNEAEIDFLKEKVEHDYHPDNIPLGNRTKPETIETFLESKMLEKDEKLQSITKGDALDPAGCIIISYSMAKYSISDKREIAQMEAMAKHFSERNIKYDTDLYNAALDKMKKTQLLTVDRSLDRSLGEYPSPEQYKIFLEGLSEKLHKISSFVTYFGDTFDVPAIKYALLANDVQIPSSLKNNVDLRWYFSHRDFNGRWISPKLKKVTAQYLGLDIFGEGSKVEEWWLAGNLASIIQHNQEDAVATLLLADKIFKVDPNYFARG